MDDDDDSINNNTEDETNNDNNNNMPPKADGDIQAKLRMARLFESNNSTSDILKAEFLKSADSTGDFLKSEFLKSVVTNERNLLNAGDSADNKAAAPSPLASPTLKSTSGSSWMQSFLATMTGGAATTTTATPRTMSGASAASAKPSAEDIANITSSKNWINLGNEQDIDVNLMEIFKTQQENDASIAVDGTKKMTSKTDWNAIAMQGLQSSVEVQPPLAAPIFKNQQENKKSKTDWNALAMQGLQTSVAVLPPLAAPVVPAFLESALKPPEVAVSSQQVPPLTAAETDDAPVAHKKTKTTKTASKKRGRAGPLVKPSPKTSRKTDTLEKQFFEPTDHDVLLGRGGRANNHPGNKTYLELKDSIQGRYMAAEKAQKTAISEELVQMVHARGGRFLKLDEATNKWYEVDATTARKKCSQTLREINTPEVRAAKRQKYST